MMITTRSNVETYRRCPYKRYLSQFMVVPVVTNSTEPANSTKLVQIGIAPVLRSVPLTTGTCVHAGVEHLLKRAMLKGSSLDILGDLDEIDGAVTVAVMEYHRLLSNSGFSGRGVTTPQDQRWTMDEQVALTEAMVRAWGMIEFPNLLRRFIVVSVEEDIAVPLIPGEITFLAKIDAVLKDRQEGSYFNYSLKTTKNFNEYMEKSYRDDLQGLTEVWASEENARVKNEDIHNAIEDLERIVPSSVVAETNIEKMKKYLASLAVTYKVMGIRFCFLVKGYRSHEIYGDKTSRMITHSPMIRGYRKYLPAGVAYAHSMWFPNPENKSGKGKLGQGWESFNVWEEYQGGVKQWVMDLYERKYQPDCGDILGEQVVTPVEYFRDDVEINRAMVEIKNQERRVMEGMEMIERGINSTPEISEYFPQYQHSCYYPDDCEFVPICKDGVDTGDTSRYVARVPHHEKEVEIMEIERAKG